MTETNVWFAIRSTRWKQSSTSSEVHLHSLPRLRRCCSMLSIVSVVLVQETDFVQLRYILVRIRSFADQPTKALKKQCSISRQSISLLTHFRWESLLLNSSALKSFSSTGRSVPVRRSCRPKLNSLRTNFFCSEMFPSRRTIQLSTWLKTSDATDRNHRFPRSFEHRDRAHDFWQWHARSRTCPTSISSVNSEREGLDRKRCQIVSRIDWETYPRTHWRHSYWSTRSLNRRLCERPTKGGSHVFWAKEKKGFVLISSLFLALTLSRMDWTSLGLVVTTWPICVAADRLTAKESPLLNSVNRRSSLFRTIEWVEVFECHREWPESRSEGRRQQRIH